MEIWKDIVGYEGFYQVSDQGRVKSLPRTRKGPYNSVLNVQERILMFGTDLGYLNVCLSKGGKHVVKKVHRLVAEAFIPNPGNKPSVNHIDAVRSNNDIKNLEWVTPLENTQHAIKMGLYKNLSGENHVSSKLTSEQVKEIRSRYKHRSYGPDSGTSLAKEFGVSRSQISYIINNKSWKKLQEEVK